jgi:hypothetical protein
VIEPSEEVRAQLAQLVLLLVRLGGKALTAYGSEVLEFTRALLADPFYEINLTGCEVLVALNGKCIATAHVL